MQHKQITLSVSFEGGEAILSSDNLRLDIDDTGALVLYPKNNKGCSVFAASVTDVRDLSLKETNGTRYYVRAYYGNADCDGEEDQEVTIHNQYYKDVNIAFDTASAAIREILAIFCADLKILGQREDGTYYLLEQKEDFVFHYTEQSLILQTDYWYARVFIEERRSSEC